MPATRLTATPPQRGPRDAAPGFEQRDDGLRRARARIAAQAGVNLRELGFQATAAFGIVKPHQELRSDRLRNNFVLKILADDAPVRK